MRAMKDSGIEWIGAIPQNWELRKIKTNFDIIAGATPKSGEASFWDGDIPWITPADYTTEGVYVSAGHKSITQDGLNSCATSLIPDGSIIFSKRAPVGLVAINSNPLCTNQGCLSCIPKESVDAKYYYYVMSIYGEQFDLFASGTTFKEISADAFANFKLPYPDYETQKRITSFLDAKCTEIDALIAAKEKTNALLKERRQSIIYEAVTKGLDPTVPMKDSGVEWIGEIPEGWQVAPLKYFASIRSGFTLGKKYDSKLELREYPYLRVANVQGEYTDLESITTIQMPAAEATQYKLKAGELLMTEGGDRDKLGRGSIWRGEIPDCLHQNHVFALSTDDRLSVDYLDYLTASDVGRNYFDYTAVKTTNLASTNATTIMNFKIPIPSIDEQLKIVAYLKEKCRTIDGIFRINSEAIQKLKEYRQSLIYETVTGKIEV